MIRRYRQTKIVATLGPASNTPAIIQKLFEAGVDVFRLNFSHGEHKDHAQSVKILREVEENYKRPVGIIVDLQGPKLRIGQFEHGSITVQKGQTFRFDLDESLGDDTRVCLPHPEVIKSLQKGAEILLDDGKVRMVVKDQHKNALDVEILAGSKLFDNKGFNLPGIVLPIPALTDKDRTDLNAALDMGVDWIAQSFVQRPEDVAEAKKLIAGRASLMAKIEKPSAIEYLDEILDLVDGVMLARGDLGVEIPPEDVPSTQKHITQKLRKDGKPIIVATQMLESMIENPRPTRAEASDVATAVYDGADAVMLSAETAVGQYPLEAVSIMDRICQSTEKDPGYRALMEDQAPNSESDPSDAITVAGYYVAQDIDAACIVNYTTSGSTALRTARQRPEIPILCLTQKIEVARRLSLSYGIRPMVINGVNSFAETVEVASKLVKQRGYAQGGAKIVLTAGVPFGTPGSTNVLRVAWVE